MMFEDWSSGYFIGFALSALALGVWNAAEKKSIVARNAPFVIFAGLTLYITSVVSLQGAPGERLFIVARDLLTQAAIAYMIRMLSQKPKMLVPAAVVVLLGYWFFYREVQEESILALSPDQVELSADQANITSSFKSGLAPNGELFVTFYEGWDGKEVRDQFSALGLSVKPAFSDLDDACATCDPNVVSELKNTLLVDIPDDKEAEIESFLSAFAKTDVSYAEQNEILEFEPLRSTPLTGQSEFLIEPPAKPSDLGLNDPEVVRQWSLVAWPYKAFAKTSAKLSKRLQPATLFVLDSGVDATHPDIKGNYKSYNAKHDRDGLGHGTHVAGIAAAVANNKEGIAGWWPQGDHPIKVSSIRVIGPFGAATQQAVVQGIINAANEGAAVINLSLGGLSTDSKQRIYANAVKYANERGTIVVVAAGNSSMDARRYAPANTPGVIAVAALDNTLSQASFSNSVDGLEMGVWAPGKDIHSLVPNAGYTPFSGTSMAAPQVAGILTLAKSIRPELTTREAYQMLNNSLQQQVQGTRDAPDVLDPGAFLEEVSK